MTDTKNMMQSMAAALDDALNEKGKPKKNGFVLGYSDYRGEGAE